MMDPLCRLARALGFDEVPPHFKEAFTHRSFAVERRIDYDNQRLEFLGDAVLELILTEYLYSRYPACREGELTKMRSSLACEEMLAAFARRLDLGAYLELGRGEIETRGKNRESTLADLFEAMLGAIYLDRGMETARQLVEEQLRQIPEDHRQVLATLNPKGRLQELSQARWNEIPRYTILQVTGPMHSPRYLAEAQLRKFTAPGTGSSRKEAESAAAAQLIAHLENELPSTAKELP